MIEDKYIELIHGEVDGINSPHESAELKAYLADNAEAKRLFLEIQKLAQVLGDVEQVAPPTHMKQRILDSIRPAVRDAARERSRFSTFFGVFRTRASLGYAYALAAGVLIGLVATTWFYSDSSDTASLETSHLSGTIVSGDFSTGFITADSRVLDTEGLEGTIEVRVKEEIVVAALALTSQEPVELFLQFEPDDLSFEGFRHLNHRDFTISTGQGVVRLAHEGENRYALVFHDRSLQGSVFTLRLVTSGESYKTTINTGNTGLPGN